MLFLSMVDEPEDRLRFRQLYHAHRDVMYRKAYGILRNEQDAEDAVQQAFEKIIANFDNISDPVCHKTRVYVVVIVERISLNLYKQRRRRTHVPLEEADLPSPAPGPEVVVEQRDGLARAIAALPERPRQVLLLKYLHGLSDREIAALLCLEAANVRQIIHRAKKQLQNYLEEQEGHGHGQDG